MVADVGSGTGISTALFLELGCETYAVEPNQAMRAAAEQTLRDRLEFHSIVGTAEATTLPGSSVDCVAAGQAFHWFDLVPTKKEFQRILKPDGIVVLFWNTRLTETSPFLRAYEDLLLRYATDYEQVDHRQVGPALHAFFEGPYEARRFPNEQKFDFDGVRGRLLSSSYAPNEGHPAFEPMMAELKKIYETGSGAVRLRGQYNEEQGPRGKRQIVMRMCVTVTHVAAVEQDRIVEH